MRLPKAMVGGSVALAGVLLLARGPADAAPGAATLYREALATTRSWTVHYQSKSVFKQVTYETSGNSGPASGTQTVNFGQGATADNAQLIVIGGFTYLKGNERAMVDLAGLPPTQAAADQGHWLVFSTDNPTYAQVVAGVRSHDVTTEVEFGGPFSLGRPRRLDGLRVDAIRGTQALTGVKKMQVVLYVRASGRHLLVEEDSVGAKGKPNGEEHITFSKWGERVRPTAPHATVTLGGVNAT